MARTLLRFISDGTAVYLNLETVMLFKRVDSIRIARKGASERAITLITGIAESQGGNVYTVGERSHPESYKFVDTWLEKHVAHLSQPRDAQGRFESHRKSADSGLTQGV